MLSGLQPDGELIEVEMKLLRTFANQPRRHFDANSIAKLSQSIKEKGIQNPLLVRRTKSHYEIVAGERRYRAAQQADLKTVPVLVKDLSDVEVREIALLDNLQREDLNPYEETLGILDLVAVRLEKPVSDAIEAIRAVYDEERGRAGNNVISNRERDVIRNVFDLVSRFTPGSFYANRIPLLKLPDDVQQALRQGELHYTKAVLIGRVKDDEARHVLLTRTVEEELAISEVRAQVRSLQAPVTEDAPTPDLRTMISTTKRRLTPSRVDTLPERTQQRVKKLLVELQSLLERND